MKVTVTTAVVELDTSDYVERGKGGQALVIQNLGAGILYYDFQDDVAAATGVQVPVNAIVKIDDWSADMTVYLIASASTDVRYVVVG